MLSGKGRVYFFCNDSSCPIRDLKGFSLSKFDRKTFRPIQVRPCMTRYQDNILV